MTTTAPKRLPSSVELLLDAAAARHGVPPALARAVAWIESRGEQSRIGTSGERGVMQLMAATAKGLGVDATVLEQNIDGGVRLLAQLLTRFGNPRALAAYNAGPRYGPQPEYKWPRSTQQYVKLVRAREQVEQDIAKGGHAAGGPFVVASEVTPHGRSSSPRSPSQPPSHGDGGEHDT